MSFREDILIATFSF